MRGVITASLHFVYSEIVNCSLNWYLVHPVCARSERKSFGLILIAA